MSPRDLHTLPLPVLYSGSCSQRQRAGVLLVKFHHGVPWPGPESAEGYGAAHRILRRMSELGGSGQNTGHCGAEPHLQILTKWF
ncbi:small nuclear ribonucleoprotein E isoform X4 [Pongo abelii]|uniref:small nuclear ribonucleoprotein E isoform X4 n=1 Tax=Pongo abelii TaxID=9601 RepID=UPI0023E8E33F|nr:small nuclear ribonucleoprotein E isoform X4 [Pongo abelii]